MVHHTDAFSIVDDQKKAAPASTNSSTGCISVLMSAVLVSGFAITVSSAVILALSVTVATDNHNDINKRREILIGIGVPLILATNVVCALLLYLALNPISKLSTWLKKKATDTEMTTLGKSRITEVRTIFGAFESLSSKLEKVKKFVPASMLAQIESDSDDGDFDGDDEDEGEVKSVFGRTTESVDHPLNNRGSVSNNLMKSTMTNLTSHSDDATKHDTSTAKQSALHRAPSHSRISSRVDKRDISKEILTGRTVSIVAFNLRDFHFSNHHADEGSLEQNYGLLLDQFQQIAKEHRGILDSFHGDRFHFTFNAVKPCHSHPTNAATAALKIAQHMASQSSHHAAIGSRITCGVATGKCLVGNLGNERAQRFSVIGAPYTQATVLERLCKRYFNTSVLLSAETAVECETHVAFMFMGLIDSPGGRNHPIASAKYVKSSKSELADEWMYEVQDQDANCDYHTGNMAFRALLRGDIPLAKKYLQGFNMKYVEAAEIKRLLEGFIKNGLKPVDLGIYYNQCIMSN